MYVLTCCVCIYGWVDLCICVGETGSEVGVYGVYVLWGMSLCFGVWEFGVWLCVCVYMHVYLCMCI